MNRLSSNCIHTFRHSGKLAAEAAAGGTGELDEGKRWVTGFQLWADAGSAGEHMPILFSGADRDMGTGILYWAIIDNIKLTGSRTTCRYFEVREIKPARKRSEIRLRNGNRQMSDDLIRPYAICMTPSFLT